MDESIGHTFGFERLLQTTTVHKKNASNQDVRQSKGYKRKQAAAINILVFTIVNSCGLDEMKQGSEVGRRAKREVARTSPSCSRTSASFQMGRSLRVGRDRAKATSGSIL